MENLNEQQLQELDAIAAQAEALEGVQDAAGTAESDGDGPTGPQPEQLNPVMFDATVDFTVGAIRQGLEQFEGGKEAADLWDTPLFKNALKPVLVKYNITLENLPCELVLVGAVAWIAYQSAQVIAEAKAKRESNASTTQA